MKTIIILDYVVFMKKKKSINPYKVITGFKRL